MWTDALTPVRWIYRGVMFLVLLIICTPITVLAQSRAVQTIRIGDFSLSEKVLNCWAVFALRVFGVRRKIYGRPLDGPVLIVANHVSWLDIQLLHSVAAMSFVAKAEIKQWPLAGFLASAGGTVYHQRGSHDSASGAAGQLLAKLAAGGRAAIFPEGGILPGEGISRFHARMFRVAVEAPCPVQPAMIRYMRGGQHYPEATFIQGESFVSSVIRMLGRPACYGELHFLKAFEVGERPRRVLADQAQAVVEIAYAR